MKSNTISTNRKATYEYQIHEQYECGLVLRGSEVKSIRDSNVSMLDSFVYVKDGEVWIKNLVVTKYKQSHPLDVMDGGRDKKLLLHKREISKIENSLKVKGTTAIPLSLYISNNKIKIKIGIATGKKMWNKKEDIKKKDIEREIRRNLI